MQIEIPIDQPGNVSERTVRYMPYDVELRLAKRVFPKVMLVVFFSFYQHWADDIILHISPFKFPDKRNNPVT